MSEFPLNIRLEPDKGTVEAWRKAASGIVKPADVEKALVLAINRTLSAVKTEALKQATSRYTIKRKDIADYFKTARATTSTMYAELTAESPRIPLLKFKVKPAAGFSFKGKPTEGRPSLFVQIRKDGGGPAKGLFVARLGREPGVYKRKGPKRFPLSSATGPSVVSMVGNKEAVDAIQTRARDMLAKRIDHEMTRLMEKM